MMKGVPSVLKIGLTQKSLRDRRGGLAWLQFRVEHDAATESTGLALLVHGTRFGERPTVADVELEFVRLDLLDQACELSGVAADTEEGHGRVPLGEVAAGGGSRDEDASRLGDVEERLGVFS